MGSCWSLHLHHDDVLVGKQTASTTTADPSQVPSWTAVEVSQEQSDNFDLSSRQTKGHDGEQELDSHRKSSSASSSSTTTSPQTLYERGLRVLQRYTRDAKNVEYPKFLLKQAAHEGSGLAAYELYDRQRELRISRDEAFFFLRMSATLCHVDAMYELAIQSRRNENGTSACTAVFGNSLLPEGTLAALPRGLHASVRNYRRASKKGNIDATLYLAQMYKAGAEEFGGPKDLDQSWELFKWAETLRRRAQKRQQTPEKKRKSIEKWNQVMWYYPHLRKALKSGAIALLDATWLIDYAAASSNNVMQPRQNLPPQAFLSYEDLKATSDFLRDESGRLNIIALSYMWLTKDHPDPTGVTLRLVTQHLKNEKEGRTWGVFWDYGSLFQHPDPENGFMRTEKQQRLFQHGLRAMGHLFSHPNIEVFVVNEFPPIHMFQPTNLQRKGYNERGWTFTEYCWATMAGGRVQILSYVASDEDDESEIQKTPPLLPEKFRKRLQRCIFTNERDDRPAVVKLYRANFETYCHHLRCLTFENLGWNDKQMSDLALMVSKGYTPNIESVELAGNQFTQRGCGAIAKALANKRTCPDFCKLILGHNPMIGDEGLKALAPVLRRLEWLDLSDCSITDDGCKFLKSTLRSQSSLQKGFLRLSVLQLEDNPIGDDGCNAIASILRYPRRFDTSNCWDRRVSFGYCDSIGYDARRMIHYVADSQRWRVDFLSG